MAATDMNVQDVQQILSRICRNLDGVARLLTGDGNVLQARARLAGAKRNLQRISTLLRPERHVVMLDSINELLSICDSYDGVVNRSSHPLLATSSEGADRTQTGGKGRPKVTIPLSQLELLYQQGYTASQMAKVFKCSKSVVYKTCYKNNIKFRDRYSNITDSALERAVADIHKKHPNSGTEMMLGYLKGQGLTVTRERVRSALKHTDPIGTAKRWGCTVDRRIYSVSCPNSLWHIDAHHKLIRWGFVTHGCVDGFSRLIPYLKCETSCHASVVLKHFVAATQKYGIPSRIRTDYGSENTQIALLMNLLRGYARGSHISGESVHNVRIERLWRDVHKEVTSVFYHEFYALEDDGYLNVESQIDKYALQLVYLRYINENLESFRKGWNAHRVRTEANRTPQQLWLNGMLQNAHSSSTATQEVFDQQDSFEERVQRSLRENHLQSDEDAANEGTMVAGESDMTVNPLGITAQQIDELHTILTSSSGRKEKFIECVAKLKDFTLNTD